MRRINENSNRFFTVLILISMFLGILTLFSGCFGSDDPRSGVYTGKSELAVVVKDGNVVRFQVDIAYGTFIDAVDLKGEWPIENDSFGFSKKGYNINGKFEGDSKIIGNLTIKTSGFPWEARKK